MPLGDQILLSKRLIGKKLLINYKGFLDFLGAFFERLCFEKKAENKTTRS